MISVPFYLYLGVILIFVSGIFYHPLIGVGAVEFAGGRLWIDIENAVDMNNIPKPDPYFYSNAFLSVLYGVPLLAMGVYFINKFRNNPTQVISLQKKLLIIILTILIVAAGMIGVAILYSAAVIPYSESQYTHPMWSPTHVSEFGTDDYFPRSIVLYTTTNPFEIILLSDVIISGQITRIDKHQLDTFAPLKPTIIEPLEPPTLVRIYTIDVDTIYKGEFTEELHELHVIVFFHSKIDYLKGDKVIFMLDGSTGQFSPTAGPYSMFKIKDGYAIGDEKTISVDKLFP